MSPIGRYTAPTWLRRHRPLCYLALILVAALYGYLFAIFGRFLFAQLLMPFIPMVMIAVWLLPESDHVPERWISRLLLSFMVALCVWPDYLGFDVPGLPWITATRLTTIPMLIVLLICTSMSQAFRRELGETLNATPLIWKCLAGFTVTAVVTLPLSHDISNSLNKLLVAVLTWIAVFFASAYVFRTPGRVALAGRLIWVTVLINAAVAVYEARYSALPWVGRVPDFLVIDDPVVGKVMSGSARAATGIYRVHTKFTTALGLGEYLGLAAPFVIHLMVTARQYWMRVAAAVTLPVMMFMVLRADSRLAVVGFLLSFMLYLATWSLLRWRRRRDDPMGPALILSYPALFAAFIAATFFVHRLHVMVWGGGATQASTDSRSTMFDRGIPMVIKNPIGHGIGQGAQTLGFYGPSGTLTIDTYWLAVALEYGVVGFILYFGMFLIGIWNAGRTLVDDQDPEIAWLAPIAIALCNFVVVKAVFSQQDNHPLVFMMLGMVVALVARSRAARTPEGVRQAAVRNLSGKRLLAV